MYVELKSFRFNFCNPTGCCACLIFMSEYNFALGPTCVFFAWWLS